MLEARQIEKGLIDRIDFEFGREGGQRLHHPPRHVTVKRIIRAEDGDAILFEFGPLQVIGIAHCEPERLRFIRQRDDAPVIVRQHRNRTPFEARIEDALARAVEAIAIDECENCLRHASRFELPNAADDYAPNDKLAAFAEHDRLVGGIFGVQFDPAALRVEALDRHLAVDHSHDDMSVARLSPRDRQRGCRRRRGPRSPWSRQPGGRRRSPPDAG